MGRLSAKDEAGMSATHATAASTFPTTSEDAAGLDARRWWALPVLLIGSFLAFLDFFIVNIALPTMQTDLGARPAQLQVVAAYGIGFGMFLITGGRLGDTTVRFTTSRLSRSI